MSTKADPNVVLPPIPAKRYFTIGEVAELCGVKPHVLRYWEQEFTQLRPMKRRGNRRYYQHHEVLLVRRIRELLYEQGFTINGARNRLGEAQAAARSRAAGARAGQAAPLADAALDDAESSSLAESTSATSEASVTAGGAAAAAGADAAVSANAAAVRAAPTVDFAALRADLDQALKLLRQDPPDTLI